MQNMEEIYNNYSKQIYKYLFCLSHNDSLSEELTQETFCIALKELHHFRGECKISVWLCQIAKNLYYKELKKSKKLPSLPLDDAQNLQDDTLESILLDRITHLDICQKISSLGRLSQEVFYLRLFGDLSFKEIGEILGKSENWARVTFYRSKQKVKESDLYE